MQISKTRSRFRPVTLLACAVVLLSGVAFVAFLRRPAVTPSTFQRHVSPPLPDGTRYTFLYPTWMQNARASVNGIQFNAVAPQRALGLVLPHAPNTLAGKVQRSLISVSHPPQDMHRESFVAAFERPLKVYSGPNAWTDSSWERDGALRHNVSLVDSRTKMKFFLFHNGATSDRRRFEEVNPVIVRSFRILPPGVPVPSP